MNLKWLLVLGLLVPGVCRGQAEYSIQLKAENSSLSLPSMATSDGILYVAYRSFDLLRFSSQLQVLSYDLRSHKELQHAVIAIPKVHGARAIAGLYLSKDGKVLAYSEAYDPKVLLLLSTKNLSEIRRSDAPAFTPEDLSRQFVGFDDHDLLAFASVRSGKLRFIRINSTDLKPASDSSMSDHELLEPYRIVWSPSAKLAWISSISMRGSEWQEYTEDGQATGQASDYRREISNGAIVLGEGQLLAFYGNMAANGSVEAYTDHHTADLSLNCVPRPYSISNVPEYTGAICTTSPDSEPENGGNQILSSEFLLLSTREPAVVWRHPMDFQTVTDSTDPNTGVQWGNPLIDRDGTKLLVVAPTKSSALAVYEVPLENNNAPPTSTTR